MIRWLRRFLGIGCPICGRRVVSQGKDAIYLPYDDGYFAVVDIGVCQHCHAEWPRW